MTIKPVLLDCAGALFEGGDERENALIAAHVLNHCLNIPVSSELDARIQGDVERTIDDREMDVLERWSMKVVQPALSAKLDGAVLDKVTIWGTTMKLDLKRARRGV